MKKMLLTVATAGLMGTTSLMAGVTGTIGAVKILDTGVMKIVVDTTNRQLVGTPDAIKAMLAVILTAKASGATVDATAGDFEGTVGWRIIILQ